MTRTKLLTLLGSAAVGISLAAYGLAATAEDKAAAPAKEAAAAKSEASTSGKDYPVVRYNGKDIMRSEFDMLWEATIPDAKASDYDKLKDAEKIQLLSNLARERVLLDAAYAQNVDKTEKVKKMLENAKRQIITQAYLQDVGAKLVNDKEVRKQYDILVEKNRGKQEVHARHILVEKEEEAKDIAKQLKEGADFDSVAATKSIDKGTGSRGGDLGYFTKDAMVPEFADAAFKLEKGKISDPVKSEFGWHIIKVEDKRDVAPPAFDDVKADLKKSLMNKALTDYLRNLLDGKKVEYLGPDGKELKPEAPEAPAAAPAADKKAEKKEEAKPAADAKKADAKKDASADAEKKAE